MAMERREENLFREWKRKYGEQFIADGVVNEAAFDASPLPRLVFVLKEVDDCAPGFDLRSFIEKRWAYIRSDGKMGFRGPWP